MNAAPRTFVSFSTADMPFVRCLLPRLTELGFDPWIYQEEGRRIPLSQDIRATLSDQLDSSTIFIPIVTGQSLASEWCAHEIAVMQDLAGSDDSRRITPVLCADTMNAHQGEWPEPYRALRDMSCAVVDLGSTVSLEDALFDICQACGLEYEPPLPEDDRLPFMTNFVSEVRDRVPHRREYEIGIYQRLMNIIVRFTEAHARSDDARMLELAEFFVRTLAYEFPGEEFYYPEVLVGYCELRMGALDAAARRFRGLSGRASANESAFTAMGIIEFKQGWYPEAETWFARAVDRDPGDPGGRSWLAMSRTMGGKTVDLERELLIEEASTATQSMTMCRAVALSNEGRLPEAVSLLKGYVERVQAKGRVDEAATLYLAQFLERSNRLDDACNALRSAIAIDRAERLIAQLAASLAGAGHLAESAREYDRLIERHPTNRLYRISAARVAAVRKQHARVATLCTAQLESGACPPPTNPDDFYHDGFANWMLKRAERAEYDFTRSGYPSHQHYARIDPS